jgi:broad specificity phosphatase PhoE
MTQAIFVRHGQSTANVGEPTKDFAKVPLTPLGEQQAAALADQWQETPPLIAVSPFLRAQQTAQPTAARFADVPVETWPIYEFTFWDPQFWKGGEPRDLMHHVDRYWRDGDPNARYGSGPGSEGAESFAMMLARAEETFARLEAIKSEVPVLLFTHGHFIQALRLTAWHPEWSASEKMQAFLSLDAERWVENTQKIPATFDGTRWKMD